MPTLCRRANIVACVFAVAAATTDAAAQGEPRYVSLMPDSGAGPSAHVVVGIPHDRQVPADWDMGWFLSIYSPTGYRVPLGRLEDKQPLGDRARILLKLPQGKYRLEVTHKPSAANPDLMGAYNIESGRWEERLKQPVIAGETVVSAEAGGVTTIEIRYDAPELTEAKNGNRTVTIHQWKNFRLVAHHEASGALSPASPGIHEFTRTTPLTAIGDSQLAAALDVAGWEAAMGLLRSKAPKADLAALVNPRFVAMRELNWAEARLAASIGDAETVRFLLSRVTSGTEETRYLAAWALGELKASAAVRPLLAALRDRNCVRGPMFSLVDLENPVPLLLDQDTRKLVGSVVSLPSDCVRDNAIRFAAAAALGVIGDSSALAALDDMANTDSEPAVREAAAAAAARIRSYLTRNGFTARSEFSGTFRSATAVDGNWTDRNYGPPPYVFCGTQSFTWNAGKT